MFFEQFQKEVFRERHILTHFPAPPGDTRDIHWFHSNWVLEVLNSDQTWPVEDIRISAVKIEVRLLFFSE